MGFSSLSSHFGRLSGASLVILGTVGVPASVVYAASTGDVVGGAILGIHSVKGVLVGTLLFTASHATLSAIGAYREVVHETRLGNQHTGSDVVMAFHRRFNGQFLRLIPSV
jgi:hypothetical protein